MKKNKEMGFYEKLGIKKFRSMVINFYYLSTYLSGFLFGRKTSYKEHKRTAREVPTNYFIGRNINYEKIKKFKIAIYFNSAIHIYALASIIKGIVSLGIEITLSEIILCSIFAILNVYCLMLQRYIYLKINRTLSIIKNASERQSKESEHVLKETNNKQNEHTYKQSNQLESLKEYREFLTNLNSENIEKNKIRQRKR